MNPLTQPFWWPLPPLDGKPAPLEALVTGDVIETPHGPFFLRRLVYDAGYHHGRCRLGDFVDLSPSLAAGLARKAELAAIHPASLAFLDAETTGLAGGTGTYAFLLGVATFAPGDDPAGGPAAWQLVVEQGMMRTYAEERALLWWLRQRIEACDGLVTFNGASFDVPLLETRFLMHRMRAALDQLPHLDLLPVARRLWKPMLQSCALQHLERHVLGIGRDDDVESFLIPAIFHQYLRDGDGRYLRRVFNHNLSDLLAMVALAAWTGRAVEHGDAARGGGIGLSATELAALGRVYEQLGRADAAERAYRIALGGHLPRDLRSHTMLALAALLKRSGRHDEAAGVWQALAQEAPAHSVPALIELAKYWEHRRRDPARALDCAAQARARWLASTTAGGRRLPGFAGPAAPPAAPDDFAPRPASGAEELSDEYRRLGAPDDFARRLARLRRKQSLSPTAGDLPGSRE